MPIGTGGAARIPGRFKDSSLDFVVEELPAYLPSGSGEHCYMWVEKTGLSTLEAVARLAAALGRRDAEFGIAGLKDARAVTRQWISIQGVPPASVRGLRLEGLVVLEAQLHGNKLKMGHLRGNRFHVLVLGAGPEHQDAARAGLAELARRGLPNYFGEQRFGKRGANLDHGLSILRGNPYRAARRVPHRLLNLVISAVQSEVFNRVLIRRLATYDAVLDGDVAWLHRNGACFLVADAAAEQARCASFEISPSGPLPGPKLLRATGLPGQIEADVLAELDLDLDLFGRLRRTHEGARRPLRVPLWQPQVEVAEGGQGLLLQFALPKGAYATAVLRELLEDCPWFG